jgi:hypothetical protein
MGGCYSIHVIASEAKQSILSSYGAMDCFASLAMTNSAEFRRTMSPDCRTALLCAITGARH